MVMSCLQAAASASVVVDLVVRATVPVVALDIATEVATIPALATKGIHYV